MASGILTAGKCKEIVVFTLLLFMWLNILTVSSDVEFKVGGNNGWVVPPSSKDDQFYNHWASNNRFKPNDILREYIYIMMHPASPTYMHIYTYISFHFYLELS